MTTTGESAGRSATVQSGEANKVVPWYELVHQDVVPLAELPPRGPPLHAAQDRDPDRALHHPRVARAREGAPLAQGVAVRLPRGAPARRRELHHLRHRRDSYRRRPVARRDQGVRERLPAPRSHAEGLRRPLPASSAAASTASPGVSTARCASRPQLGEFPRVEPDSADWQLPEAKVGTWGGFVFINPDPDAGPARGLPRRPARALRALGLRAPLPRGPRRQDAALQLEDRPGGVRRGSPPGCDAPAGVALRR